MKIEPQPKGTWPKIKRFIIFMIGLIVVINVLGVIVGMLSAIAQR